MEKLIFCKFLDHEENPRGRDYTYATETEVKVGDFVEVEVVKDSSGPHKKKIIVTKVDIDPGEIHGYETFKDRIQKIKGLWVDDEKLDSKADPSKPFKNISNPLTDREVEDILASVTEFGSEGLGL